MVNHVALPIVLEWLRESDNDDTRALRAQALEYIESLERPLRHILAARLGSCTDCESLKAMARAALEGRQ